MMKMNKRMTELLKNVDVESLARDRSNSIPLALVMAGGSVLLSSCWKQAQHILPSTFSDRTGYECFINHTHLPWRNEGEVLAALNLVFELRRGLIGFAPNWVAEDLEGYLEEAILVVDAPAERTQTT